MDGRGRHQRKNNTGVRRNDIFTTDLRRAEAFRNYLLSNYRLSYVRTDSHDSSTAFTPIISPYLRTRLYNSKKRNIY